MKSYFLALSQSPRGLSLSTSLRLLGLFLLAIGFAAGLPVFTSATRQESQEVSSASKNHTLNAVPGELIVRFRAGSASATKTGQTEQLDVVGKGQISMRIETLGAVDIVDGLRLVHVATDDTASALEGLRARSDVIYAEPNFIRRKSTTPNDPGYSDLWALKNTGQSGGTAGVDMKAEQAWDITTGSSSIVVAVIDEGINTAHPDLQPNIWQNPAEIAANGVDDDGNGYVDDINGYDFFHNDASVYDGPGTNPDGSPIDAHATHVAGTIGARGNNALGVVGVNWQVSLMSLKFLGPDGGSSADLLKAFTYAKLMHDLWISSGGTKGANIRVTNNSYGGGAYSQAESDAIQALGASDILFVAAAGNENEDNNTVGSYPATYDLPNVISVAAIDREGKLATFTNKGSRTVHIGAPGVSINSTLPGSSYGYTSGTSMASPQVAGAAALVLAAHPAMTTARLRAAVLFSGTPSIPLDDTTVTGRALNAFAAMQNANETDTTAPAVIANLNVAGQDGRTVVLNWTTAGDDGNSGQASLSEIRFVDGATSARFLLNVTRPPVAGTSQALAIGVPYRHSTGSFVIRTIDNVGNFSDSSIAVSVSTPEIADPYTVTPSATEPLSTGGQALGITQDDAIANFSLPFNFPYYQRSYNLIGVSSNGALYLGTPPSRDPFSFSSVLDRRNVIAGHWDDLDLRRCFRADSDVYKVTPDSDRVIFRWQGVRFSDSLCPASPTGAEPINFEIELNRNGTIKMRYGQNTLAVPVVGIGGGEPEGYVVASHTASDAPKDLTNAQTLTFGLRRQPDVTDLSLSSVASSGFIPYGQDVSFTLTATNQGPTRTSGVFVNNTLPFGAIFVSCTAPQGMCSTPKNGVLRVDFPLIESGATANYTVVIQGGPTSTNPFINRGSIKGPLSDPSTNNNDADSLVQLFIANQNPQTGLIGIGAGGNQSFAVRSDRYGLAWGSNSAGQLGDGSITDKWVPVRIYGTLTSIAAIEGGLGHTLALRLDGSVWSWGANNKGQLGDGTNVDHKLPARISGLTSITRISGGGSHSLALRSDGTVWAWGDNSSGQLGDGSTSNRSAPVQAQGLTNIVAIAGGYNHSLAIKNDGSVWAWGANESGQLGQTPSSGQQTTPIQVSGISNAVAVTAGDGYQYFGGGPTTISFSVVARSDGTVWTWGNNFEGQLGDGTSNNLRSTPGQVVGLTGVTTVAAGANHVLALRGDGTVWAWGDNDNGALGDTTRTDRKTPVKVAFLTGIQAIAAGYQHSLALRQDGHVFGWGSFTYGQLGFGGSSGVREFPYEASAQVPDAPPIGTMIVPTFSPDGGSFFGSQSVGVSSAQLTFNSLSTGYQHVLTRMSDGGVYGWGYNIYGQLGLDPGSMFQGIIIVKTPRRFPELDNTVGVAAGGTHSLAVKNNGTVFSWGSNFGGELGYDTNRQVRFTPTLVPGVSGVTAVAAGNQSVALKNDGTVLVWGGPNLIQTPTLVNGLNSVVSIACGNVTFAIRNDGTLWGWGRNPNGELADGTQTDRTPPVQAAGLSNVVAAASGGGHSVALRSDGSVWTWGNNFYGQLGLGFFNSQPQLTPIQVPGISNVIAVAAGSNYTLALKSDGTVWAWGANHHGQLGYTGVNQVSPTQISGLANITAIAGGYEFALARRGDGLLFSWGDNQSSQLGDGTTDSQSGVQQVTQLNGGIEIHYTTNGSDPTSDDPFIGSGGTILVDHSMTLKARAFKYGWLPSAAKSANFSISTNQIDETTFFVRQHYLDFLNRVADPDGLAFWTGNINSCGTDNACREVKRIDTSAAYFLSIEFQETGYLVHRFYRASFNRRPLFNEFLTDTQTIGNGVVVNSPGWQQALENNKVAFANAWVTKPAFATIYGGLTNAQFVDTLIANTGVTFTPTDRNSYVDVLNNQSFTRAQVVRAIAENHEFYNAEYSPAFVEMQYFGYLRRDPDTGGFNFWLNKLNQHGGDFRAAEMVKSFLVSGEYRQRFDTP